MVWWKYILAAVLFFFSFKTPAIIAQVQPAHIRSDPEGKNETPLFSRTDIVKIRITGNLDGLYRDIGENNAFHPFLLEYTQGGGSQVPIAIRVRTRGHFRRQKGVCAMPPLLLDFPADKATANTLFAHQKKLKLVVPCTGDDYVIREFLVYKLYNLVTSRSFRNRLAQVTFVDSAHKVKTTTHYCFLLEEDREMAARNDCFVWKKDLLGMGDISQDALRIMAVFQYLIGNTDWGLSFLQNIVLITSDSLEAPYAVPYDFDQAGIVDAPYAVPHAELGISSNLIRLYRGRCEQDIHQLDSTFSIFNRLKPQIYNIYDSCNLITSKYRKFVHRFLDGFYRTINSRREIEKEFSSPCNTQKRIEIKGLKN